MKKKEIIKSLIKDFHHKPLPEFSPRAISIPLDLNKIISLIGARRSGKTYLLYQTIGSLLKQTEKPSIISSNCITFTACR